LLTCVWPAFLCSIFQELKIVRTEHDILKSFIPMGNDYIYIFFLYIIIFYTFVFIIQLFLNLITIHNMRSVHTCTRGGKYMYLKYNISQWNVLYYVFFTLSNPLYLKKKGSSISLQEKALWYDWMV
jgi:hypothetical protein